MILTEACEQWVFLSLSISLSFFIIFLFFMGFVVFEWAG
jgi:hypothetical protein